MTYDIFKYRCIHFSISVSQYLMIQTFIQFLGLETCLLHALPKSRGFVTSLQWGGLETRLGLPEGIDISWMCICFWYLYMIYIPCAKTKVTCIIWHNLFYFFSKDYWFEVKLEVSLAGKEATTSFAIDLSILESTSKIWDLSGRLCDLFIYFLWVMVMNGRHVKMGVSMPPCPRGHRLVYWRHACHMLEG